MREKILKYLLGLRMDPSNIGFKHLTAALEECINNEELLYKTCDLYKITALKCNSTPSKVERSMRHSISKIEKSKISAFVARAFYELKLQEVK